MSNSWMVFALVSTIVALVRELLGSFRYMRRRTSIERIATRIVAPGTHLVDEDEHGARFSLTVERRQPEPPTTGEGTAE